MGLFQFGKRDSEQQLANMLEAEQFKSNLIIESISDGVLVTNNQGTVELLNDSAASLLGWDKNEALHLDYRSLIKPISESGKELEPDAISQSMQSSKSVQKLSQLETRNQRQFYVDIVASPIMQTVQGEDGNTVQKPVGTIAVLRNVDQQKRAEQQRSDFISTASHEMRTPVASIEGFLELALNPKVSVIDDKARGYLTKALAATKHLGELFQDLLTVSKSDDGRLTNHPEIVEVGAFLKELITESTPRAEQKGLKVSLEFASGNSSNTVVPLMYINADPNRLREVVSNLFDNAVKYTKTGMITVGASLKDRGVVIRISDTGIGIAAEDIPHLFQKFYRTDNSDTREIGGTGLGLYICKQIVEMMGGKVYVESTVGTGSTFFVELPRVPDELVMQAQNQPASQS